MIRFSEGLNGQKLDVHDAFDNKTPYFDSKMSVDVASAFWDREFESFSDISIIDILNYDEESFSFDIDLSDMKELLNKFNEEEWVRLSDEEKEETIDELVKTISGKLELKEIPDVGCYDADPSDCGFYDPGNNLLGINACELDDPRELVNTIAHELRHAYQYQCAENPDSYEDKLYRINIDNYIKPVITEAGECLLFLD